MTTDMVNSGKLAELVRIRVHARLRALGGRSPLSFRSLCDAWSGAVVNGEPALRHYHVERLMKSSSPKLREMAQLATMMGIPLTLLVCGEDWADPQGRTAMSCIIDLDAYPPPPAVASILTRAV